MIFTQYYLYVDFFMYWTSELLFSICLLRRSSKLKIMIFLPVEQTFSHKVVYQVSTGKSSATNKKLFTEKQQKLYLNFICNSTNGEIRSR